jgi:hypothetical protein
MSTFGGSTYVDANSTGTGYGKISSTKSYCGLLSYVYQYWTSQNTTTTNTNGTYNYLVFGPIMIVTGLAFAVTLLTV